MSDKVTKMIEDVKALTVLELAELVKALEAVSYTHLDVYKRQSFRSAMIISVPARPCSRTLSPRR